MPVIIHFEPVDEFVVESSIFQYLVNISHSPFEPPSEPLSKKVYESSRPKPSFCSFVISPYPGICDN